MAATKLSYVDRYVAGVIRLRRSQLGMSQKELAKLLGIKYQQVQKYEKGTNKVYAGRLYQIARALEVPVSYFFEDLPEDTDIYVPPKGAERPDEKVTIAA